MQESRRAWFWGLCIPLATVILTATFGPEALLLLLIYPLQTARLALRGTRSPRENWWRAASLVLCCFPEVVGQMKYILDHYRRVPARLIEYK